MISGMLRTLSISYGSILLSNTLPPILYVLSIPVLLQNLPLREFTLISSIHLLIAFATMLDFGSSRRVLVHLGSGKHLEEIILPTLILLVMGQTLIVVIYYLLKLNILLFDGGLKELSFILIVFFSVTTLVARSTNEAYKYFQYTSLVKTIINSLIIFVPILLLAVDRYDFQLFIMLIIILKLFETAALSLKYFILKGFKFYGLNNIINLDQLLPSIWLTISNIVGGMYIILDRIIIKSIGTDQIIANFAIAQDLHGRVALLLGSAVTLIMPYWIQKQLALKHLLSFVLVLYAVILTLIISINYIPDELVTKYLFFGFDKKIIILYLCVLFVQIPANLILMDLHSSEKYKLPALSHLLQMLVYVIFLFLFIEEMTILFLIWMVLIRAVCDLILLIQIRRVAVR